MNAEQLLAHYDRIADAPDAIARLRRVILDLAVRGKLVPHDANDEPASELLKRIAKEKARLANAGEIRTPKALPEVDDLPFDLPPSWRWTRMREIASDRGQEIPKAQFTYIDVTAIDKEVGVVADPKVLKASEAPSRARKITRKGDVIYSCVRPYLLNVAVIEADFDPKPIASTAFAVLNGHGLVLPRYLWIVLRSPFMVECVEANQRGQAYPAIKDADFAVLPFPLAPLAEQRRIVAKVDELMALCDQLEAARTEREATRDRLAAASLARLNTPDPKTFPADARFALDALPFLTVRADQIKQLRRAILNLAVQGRLVDRRPDEGGASVLVENMLADRTQLGRRAIEPDTRLIDFAIPSHWAWQSLDQVVIDGPQNGLSPRKSERSDAPKAITLTATTSGIFDGQHFKRVEVNERELDGYWLDPGDLLFQRGNTPEYVGMAAIYDGSPNEFLFPDLIMRVKVSQRMSARFVHLWCLAPFARRYLTSNATGAQKTMPKINQSTLKATPIAVPPVREQERIVAKVDALMGLCDQLEASLASTDDTRRCLLDALLAEALQPALQAAA